MSIIENTLRSIDGGNVLDVATQEGHFVQILRKYLKSYTEIIGVDLNPGAIDAARVNVDHAGIRFQVMDAERLAFENERFDTVTISASLHHLANIPRVLAEMVRVLKPGGHFILVEIHCDAGTEAELTSVYLHQWVAAVDSALGHLHNSTLARQEFVDYIADLGLREVTLYDEGDEASDPMEKTRIEQLDDLIERTMQRAGSAANAAELKEQGTQLRQRLHEIGARREPIILIVGQRS